MTSLRTRIAIASPILVFWGVMTAWLWHREVGVGGLDSAPNEASRLEAPVETWLGLYAATGARVGTLHLQQVPQRRHDRPGVTHVLALGLSVNLFGKTSDLDLSGSSWRPYEGSEAEFEFDVRSGEYDFHVEGRIEGGELRGEVHSAGERIPLHLPVDEEVVFASGVGSALSFPQLEVGDEVRLQSFDPLTFRTSPVRVRCVARQKRRVAGEDMDTRVLQVTGGGLRSKVWIDSRGEVVRAETPLGLVLEAIPPQDALTPTTAPTATTPTPGGELGDLLDLAAIRPSGKSPFRGARRMVVALTGVESERLPTDEVQRALEPNRYELRPATAPLERPAESPASELAPFLVADAFVQSDNPRIRRQAAAIVGREEDPWRKAQRLHRWVFEELEKEAVLSLPSAIEVLQKRRGDCNEHTVLFTALARAVGLPTRIAVGVVWSDAYGGFYYHAWPEVHLGTWVWMDPTLGQTIADATHVKLLNGGIEAWPQLLPYLGQLEMEVVEVE